MTNDELQKKISEIIDGSVDDWATRDRRGRIQVHVSTIADILVKAGLKFDASISHTATFDLLQQNRINELEKRIAEAEHRAARAKRAGWKEEKRGARGALGLPTAGGRYHFLSIAPIRKRTATIAVAEAGTDEI